VPPESSEPSVIDRSVERLPGFLPAFVNRVRSADLLLFAGGLAFYGLISLAPLVVLSFWITGALVGEDRMEQLGENLAEMAPAGAEVEGFFDQMATIGTGVGVGALVAALWPATAYGSGLLRAFDRISHAPRRSMQGIRGRAKTLALLALMPLLLLGALFASYVATGTMNDGLVGMIFSWALALAGGLTAGFVAITLIYWLFGPDEIAWRHLALGSLLAAGGIAVMSLGYVVYMGEGADFEERIAGSGLAAIVLLGIWLYLANIIILAGYCLATERHAAAHPEEDAQRAEEESRPPAPEELVDLVLTDGLAEEVGADGGAHRAGGPERPRPVSRPDPGSTPRSLR
jgi:membrane protein